MDLLFKFITNNIFLEQKKISLNEEKMNYLRTSLEEKKLKREATANYRAEKLKILREMFQK